jgi:hypothetical protein
MNRTTTTLCLAAGLLVSGLLLTSDARSQTPAARRPAITYAESARLAALPRTSLQTFTTQRSRPVTPEEASRLVEKVTGHAKVALRLDPEAGKTGGILFFRGQDPSAVLSLDPRRGDFLFNKGLAAYSAEKDTPGLPSKEEALQLAQRYLESLQLALPSEEAAVVHVGGLNMAVHREDGSTADYRKLVTVRFGRKLGGLPVVGDSRAIVQLGERGELAGLTWDWLPAKGRQIAAAELRGEEQIRAEIERRLRAESGSPLRIVVQSQELVLYDDGRTLEPAIRVKAERTYQVKMVNGKDQGQMREYTVPYDAIVPVLARPRAAYPHMKAAEVTRKLKRDQPGELRGDPKDDEPRPKGLK